MATDTRLNSRNAFVYIRVSYRIKNCRYQVAGAPLFWTPPRNRRLAPSLTPRSYTSGTQIRPNVYLADALPREPSRVVRGPSGQPGWTVTGPKHGNASCSHKTFLSAHIKLSLRKVLWACGAPPAPDPRLDLKGDYTSLELSIQPFSGVSLRFQ
jgi:hypothetical protein